MSKFTFRPAVRDSHTPLLIGLIGPSGGGKTFSALRLATGIQSVRGGDIVYIDTEAKRALHYADKFKFLHASMNPPFSSMRYMEALEEAVEVAKGGVVIIDSMSHEHEGEGGLLEAFENELDRLAGNDYNKRNKMKMLAWQKPKQNRRRLINKLLQLECVFIFCFRAKEKLKMIAGKEPIPLGWQAIAGEEFAFEMTVRCLLPPGANGTPDWGLEAFDNHVAKLPDMFKEIFKKGRTLDESVGKEMALWAAGGDNDKTEEASAGSKPKPQAEQPEEFDIDQREVLESEIADNLDGLGDEEIKDEVIKKLKGLSSMDKQREIVFKYTSGKKITELYGDQLKKAAIKILADIGEEE